MQMAILGGWKSVKMDSDELFFRKCKPLVVAYKVHEVLHARI